MKAVIPARTLLEITRILDKDENILKVYLQKNSLFVFVRQLVLSLDGRHAAARHQRPHGPVHSLDYGGAGLADVVIHTNRGGIYRSGRNVLSGKNLWKEKAKGVGGGRAVLGSPDCPQYR